MQIPTAAQIRNWDAYTIQHEPISSIELMERASITFVNWFNKKFPNQNQPVHIFCGMGNNGGDGLAIARLLQQRFHEVEIFICKIGANPSSDFLKNKKRLPKFQNLKVYEISKDDPLPKLPKGGILIDAIFGSGLNRAVEGYWGELIEYLNAQSKTIVSVDIPSGVFADQPTKGISIHANYTFSFEVPKLAFLFPENEKRVGEWSCASIGLHPDFLQTEEMEKARKTGANYFLEKKDIQKILKGRQQFSHKGTFGHALIIAGSYGKGGAAVLATKAALKIGAGLVTTHIPKSVYTVLQISAPEAMVSVDEHEFHFSKIKEVEKYNAVGIGCGLGMEKETVKALLQFLEKVEKPIVVDADALNILAENKKWMEHLPAENILTPHPKEFERLFGKTKNNFERNQLQRELSKKNNIYIVLKGAHTCISTPTGDCFFNSTGNPGMATGGSGDVLTGMLTGLLAQGYNALETSKLSVYLHGLTGDVALGEMVSQESLLASDLIKNIGKAFNEIRKD